MAGLLNIGLTGLNAAQAQLATTSHNISNAGTKGYHRQTVGQGAQDPLFTGVGFFGQGTQVNSITRSYDQFLEAQVTQADNRLSFYATYNEQVSQINNLLADSTTGLSPAMQGFFAGMQEVASNPTSVAARQALISNAQSLTERFHSLHTRLEEVRDGVEGGIRQTIEGINSYATALAEMNQQIVVAQAAGAGTPANDLLDRRDQLLAELNQLVKITVVEETDSSNKANGAVSVFIGSGQALVLRGTVSKFEVIADANDPKRGAISMVAPNGNTMELSERLLTGGQLGGLLEFRRDTLDRAQNELGLVALGISEAVNAQHKLGIDLEGVLGKDFFKPLEVGILPSTAGASASIADFSQVLGRDYQAVLDSTGANLLLMAGKDVVGSIPTPATWPATISGAGLDVTIPSLASVADKGLLIQPVRHAAKQLTVAIREPAEVAAGSPVGVEAPLVNQGTGKLSGIDLRSVAGIASGADGKPDFAPFALGFTANTLTAPAGHTIERLTYNPLNGAWEPSVPSAAGPSAAFDPAVDSSGARYRVVGPGGYSFDFDFAGTPEAGDQFVFSPNAAGVADNRNAVALGALQTSKTMLVDGDGRATATFQSLYAQTVTMVGNKTREVQVNESAQQALLDQATTSRDSISGVNMDEEAANLGRFQLAYQASARVMTVAQRLFDELVAIGR